MVFPLSHEASDIPMEKSAAYWPPSARVSWLASLFSEHSCRITDSLYWTIPLFHMFFAVNSIIKSPFFQLLPPTWCKPLSSLPSDTKWSFLPLVMKSLIYYQPRSWNSLFQDRHNHVNPLLKTLPWLPIVFRTKSKLLSMAFRLCIIWILPTSSG